MKRFFCIAALVLALVTTSCVHKELCDNHSEHAHRYHINIIADYRLDWEEKGYRDWSTLWPEDYIDYDLLRPKRPKGLRAVNYSPNGNYNIHNIPANGGVVTLYEGENDILFYNNDTEYIVFSRHDNGATTRATTRAVTRATYSGNTFAEENEATVNAPDMLFANYHENYMSYKTLGPVDYPIELQPLVFTYKIRYEFEAGLKYVALARGALSGMAESVQMNTGETSNKGATIIFDCDLTDFGARALVNSFGVPGYINEGYPTTTRAVKHGLNLEVMLRNGKMVTFEFDVSDQVNAQPHGGVIVVKGISIKEEDGVQGSGSFDVEVDDWGEYNDIVLPL
jgi:hypothetical protein